MHQVVFLLFHLLLLQVVAEEVMVQMAVLVVQVEVQVMVLLLVQETHPQLVLHKEIQEEISHQIQRVAVVVLQQLEQLETQEDQQVQEVQEQQVQ